MADTGCCGVLHTPFPGAHSPVGTVSLPAPLHQDEMGICMFTFSQDWPWPWDGFPSYWVSAPPHDSALSGNACFCALLCSCRCSCRGGFQLHCSVTPHVVSPRPHGPHCVSSCRFLLKLCLRFLGFLDFADSSFSSSILSLKAALPLISYTFLLELKSKVGRPFHCVLSAFPPPLPSESPAHFWIHSLLSGLNYQLSFRFQYLHIFAGRNEFWAGSTGFPRGVSRDSTGVQG